MTRPVIFKPVAVAELEWEFGAHPKLKNENVVANPE